MTNLFKTVLYTGVTNDLNRRLEEHISSVRTARKNFTGKYRCQYLIYYEWYMHIEDAIAREKQIKGWTRDKKERLIASFNPDWRFLNDPVEIAKGDLPFWCVGDDYWQPGTGSGK
ncbi:MAG: GIY-YIG nuclease family protein [Saprospiraceae bacterium]|nr:GIY-YIG nuclease family protein [Saprospiraceae bacterium]